ncbi:hypothetical protein GCM10023212_15350 [Luteolibacter yonseiensis]
MVLVVAAIAIVYLQDALLPSHAAGNLPEGATEIQEFYADYGIITGDFVRLLKARIPENQVAEYARKVGAVDRAGDGDKGRYPTWSREADWFKPRKPPLYYRVEPGYRLIVGWENGYVYYDACAW